MAITHREQARFEIEMERRERGAGLRPSGAAKPFQLWGAICINNGPSAARQFDVYFYDC